MVKIQSVLYSWSSWVKRKEIVLILRGKNVKCPAILNVTRTQFKVHNL